MTDEEFFRAVLYLRRLQSNKPLGDDPDRTKRAYRKNLKCAETVVDDELKSRFVLTKSLWPDRCGKV